MRNPFSSRVSNLYEKIFVFEVSTAARSLRNSDKFVLNIKREQYSQAYSR